MGTPGNSYDNMSDGSLMVNDADTFNCTAIDDSSRITTYDLNNMTFPEQVSLCILQELAADYRTENAFFHD